MVNKSKVIMLTLLSVCAVGIILCVVFLLGDSNGGITKIANLDKTVEYELVEEDTLDYVPHVIKIDADSATINLKNSTDGKLHVAIWADKNRLTYNKSEYQLTVIQKSKRTLNGNNKTAKIEVRLPAEFDGKFNVNSDCGDVNIESFSAAAFNVKSDYGNVTADSIKDITAECDAGNIVIKSLNGTINAKSDYGNIRIDKAVITDSSKIGCDSGNVEINSINDICIKTDISAGSVDVKTNNPSSPIVLEISTDYGSITVK